MRLVIADDHQVVREGLRFMLDPEAEVEVVAEAGSGAELLDLLARNDDIDVVLLDIRMPEMSGFEVLEKISTTSPDVAVVILSMHDDAAYVKRALRLGASGYLLKNVGQVELLRALELITHGDTYVQGELSGLLLAETAGRSSSGERVTSREREILQMVADGSANKQIAVQLDLSEATVKWYLKNVFAKLEANSRAEAVATALRTNLIT